MLHGEVRKSASWTELRTRGYCQDTVTGQSLWVCLKKKSVQTRLVERALWLQIISVATILR